VDAYETVMRVKHIQLAAEKNSFMLRDNSHYSGMCALIVTKSENMHVAAVLI